MKSTITFLFFGTLVAVSFGKPISNLNSRKFKTTTTTPAPMSFDDDGLDALINAGLMGLGNGVTCDSWIESKMKAMGTNVDDLAKMIVDAEPKELALEFIVFCLMDDQPMSDRPNMLKVAIDEEKMAMQAASTTPKPVAKQIKPKNARKI